MSDPELPAGFSDADMEQAELEETGRTLARIRKAGKCAHGWRRGRPGPEPPADDDPEKCLECGKAATRRELDDDARELHAEFG